MALAWAREIEGERLGTAMEPIVAGERVFVGTHAGNVYALRADTGDALWRFKAQGAFLHSPAFIDNIVVAGSTDGTLYGVAADSGELRWHYLAGQGGFSASPLIFNQTVYIGTRSGEFLALSPQDGNVLWREQFGLPIRQTAAAAGGVVFVTGEDLKVRALRARDGKLVWVSEPLPGQTARDYYPVVVVREGCTYVIVRTNPLLNMGQRIGRDRAMLCRNAGVDDSTWQKLEAWLKSDQARGNAELWAKEQRAIIGSLQGDPSARSFFVFDGATGVAPYTSPMLWVAGCQGVGAEPAVTSDGRLLVFRRSAYGNWNLGVAPPVALGLYDLEKNDVTPLFHGQGAQPTWNCFWGTADESQNFVVVGETVLIVHQGTLSGFNLTSKELFPIWGERDTYGGFQNPTWARNEWHGPARSAVAVAGERLYWQTGSRILCLKCGESSQAQVKPLALRLAGVPLHTGPDRPVVERADLRNDLARQVAAILAQTWAPLFTDPGLAGRVFAFDHSGELFEAVAWAYPHLPSDLKVKARTMLRGEWTEHPPFTGRTWFTLEDGKRREYFSVPKELCARLGEDPRPQPFGNLYAVALYARRCDEERLVLESWPGIKRSYEEFIRSGWRLDAVKGDLYANRYLASLFAFREIAEKVSDSDLAHQAGKKADETAEALVAWWRRAADSGTLRAFNKSSDLDPFIKKGDGIWFAVAPHRHALALFKDLTPEVAALVASKAPKAADAVWETFASICPTWSLAGEERQVHYGENFLDPPEFALGAFRAQAWLRHASVDQLAWDVDLPFCRADLYYVIKLAIALEQTAVGSGGRS
jgi:hypothetical protein